MPGQTTNIFTNTAIIQAVLSAQSGNAAQAMFALALGSYFNMYPVLLIPPVLLIAHQSNVSAKPSVRDAVVNIGYFVAALAVLIGSTVFITGDIWQFITSCYGMQLTVPDLTPMWDCGGTSLSKSLIHSENFSLVSSGYIWLVMLAA